MKDREIAKQAITHDIRNAILRARLVAEVGMKPVVTTRVFHEQLLEVVTLTDKAFKRELARMFAESYVPDGFELPDDSEKEESKDDEPKEEKVDMTVSEFLNDIMDLLDGKEVVKVTKEVTHE